MAAFKGEGRGVLLQTNPRNQNSIISRVEDGILEKNNNEANIQHPRDGISTWKWALTCVGLYLGALLYGLLHCTNKDGNSHANTSITQVSTQQLQPMFKVQFTRRSVRSRTCNGLGWASQWRPLL